jgi:hypothetical protein
MNYFLEINQSKGKLLESYIDNLFQTYLTQAAQNASTDKNWWHDNFLFGGRRFEHFPWKTIEKKLSRYRVMRIFKPKPTQQCHFT